MDNQDKSSFYKLPLAHFKSRELRRRIVISPQLMKDETLSSSEVIAPVFMDFRFILLDADYLVRGSFSTTVRYTCSRCLSLFEAPLANLSFHNVYSKQAFSTEDREIDLQASDLEICVISGSHIDLRELVREQLLLNQPINPICSEDCLGLCVVCGKNLNHENCGCHREAPDPRMSVLRSLRKDRQDGF